MLRGHIFKTSKEQQPKYYYKLDEQEFIGNP